MFFSIVSPHSSSCAGRLRSLRQIVEHVERKDCNKNICTVENWRHTGVGVSEVTSDWKSECPAAKTAHAAWE